MSLVFSDGTHSGVFLKPTESVDSFRDELPAQRATMYFKAGDWLEESLLKPLVALSRDFYQVSVIGFAADMVE